MIDSRVLLPEPEAPTTATDSRAASEKWMSWSIVSVPVESLTCLVTWSTSMMGGSELMFDVVLDRTSSRREWLLQCSRIAAGAVALRALPSRAATPLAVILVLGDSLSAEYGLARGTGWVALLEQRLAREKISASVVNASISGDTTSGGRSRLPALLAQHKPTHVVIELGGNDALRGLPLAMTQDNLTAMARTAKEA